MKKLIIYLAALFAIPVIVFGQDVESGLKAHWDFESIDSGFVRDNSENKLHLRIMGNPEVVEGITGNAMFFDGNDDYLEIPMPKELYFDKDSAMTISVWAKPIRVIDTDGSGAGCVLTSIPLLSSYRYNLYNTYFGLKFSMQSEAIGSEFNKLVDSLNWHLYVAVLSYDSGTYKLKTFSDGCFVNESSGKYGNINYRYEGLYIAATHHCSYSLNYARAYIDEVRIYNRTLTQLDIAQLYIDGGGNFSPALEIDQTEIDLGEVPCNSDTTFSINFHNPGESGSRVFDIKSSSGEDNLVISEKTFDVEPGETKEINIDYKPLGDGEIRDTLFVLTEGPCDSIIVPIYIKARIEELNVEIDAIKTGFCLGDTAILKTKNEYLYYEWHKEGSSNVLSVTREYRTIESGTYYVIVRDENGCEGISDIIEITFSDLANGLEILSISESGEVEFDETLFPNISCRIIEIRNTAEESLTLYDAKLFENIHFSIPQSQFPLSIPAGETVNLQVCYSPQKLGEARDTLAIEDFCATRYIPLHGICPPNVSMGNSKCDVKTQVITTELPDKGVFSASAPVPNPSTGIIEVNYIISEEQNISCTVTNSLGIRINTGNISQNIEYHNDKIRSVTERINLSDYPAGIYFINLTNGCDVFGFNVSLYK